MERRIDQYMFTREYDKTFITGNLKGLTVPVKYGTCTVGAPYDMKDGTILTDAITHAKSVVSNYRHYRNY
jgi:hypothetical protein